MTSLNVIGDSAKSRGYRLANRMMLHGDSEGARVLREVLDSTYELVMEDRQWADEFAECPKCGIVYRLRYDTDECPKCEVDPGAEIDRIYDQMRDNADFEASLSRKAGE